MATLLALAFRFGGVGYVPFAALMYIWIGRIRTLGKTQALSFAAPVLFLPFLVAGVVVLALLEGGSLQLVEAIGAAGVLVFYGLIVGYLYVVLANVMALILELLGWLSEENPGRAVELAE